MNYCGIDFARTSSGLFVPRQVNPWFGQLAFPSTPVMGSWFLSEPEAEGVEPVPTRKSQETILAWRAWDLAADSEGPVLQSLGSNFNWAGPVVHAHTTPTQLNNAGLYAVKQEHSRELAANYDEAEVFGEVQLFGTIVVCEKGYRAEHALIRSLAVRCPPGMIPDPYLAERYACEVTIWKED